MTREILHLVGAGAGLATGVVMLRQGLVCQLEPPEDDLVQLIALLRKLCLFNQAVPTMLEYLRSYVERAVPVRLALADVLIEHWQRPRQALAVLAKINPSQLDAAQRRVVEKAAYERDPYEVAPEDW